MSHRNPSHRWGSREPNRGIRLTPPYGSVAPERKFDATGPISPNLTGLVMLVWCIGAPALQTDPMISVSLSFWNFLTETHTHTKTHTGDRISPLFYSIVVCKFGSVNLHKNLFTLAEI